MAIQHLQRRLQLDGQSLRVGAFFGFTFARHEIADVLPQIAVERHLATRQIVGYRHARQFDDAALDGVHQRKIRHRPGEQRAFGITRAAQEERRSRQVVHGENLELALDCFEARNPDARGFVVFFGEAFVFAAEWALDRFGAVAVVRLVVDHDDAFEPHQIGDDALQHLSGGLTRVDGRAVPLEQITAAAGEFYLLAEHEGVVVGDDDFGTQHFFAHLERHQLALGEVAVGVVGVQHAQAIADGDTRRDHQEARREAFGRACARGVDGLPGDEHSHHGGFAGTGGQLERNAEDVWVGVGAGVTQMLEPGASFGVVRGDFVEPYGGLGCFDLTKKRPQIFELVTVPVGQQLGRSRGHVPFVGR